MARQFRINANGVTLQSGAVDDEAVGSGAAIDADKLQHVEHYGTNFGLAIGATPVAAEHLVFVAQSACVVRGFRAMLNDTGTSTSVAFDLKKNGTTILSGVVTITHSDSDRDVLEGTISNTALAVGDVLSISLAVTSSTGAQGPWAQVEVEYSAS